MIIWNTDIHSNVRCVIIFQKDNPELNKHLLGEALDTIGGTTYANSNGEGRVREGIHSTVDL